ncbi:ParB N-terminal domain-containing protein [Chryseobacterium viscerum]|uniref:DNA methylase n=1 Tax=Chryseobacterium viscerum TaxID=1037377 RepID=A0A5N4BJ38_9FLAO|nr:ParB N-terminal domain-containing protein [Chryseobacterium viscerum]KAB1228462.1 DNA methylase [Chryseobacterium viscerum]
MAKQTRKKYKESETIYIQRSLINFAPYNPKNHTKAQVEELKANIKRVGFLGGIVWNKITGNLVDGHKRVMSLDILNGYDGTLDTDYEIKVEITEMDEKTEKEQNIFQTRSRTEFDEELLRLLVPEIDYEAAGLTDYDLEFLGIDLNPDTADEVLQDLEDFYKPVKDQKELEKAVKKELSDEEKKENVKNVKEDIQQKAIEKVQNMDAYVTLSFDSWQNKEAFMLRFDFDPELKMIKGERLSGIVERID